MVPSSTLRSQRASNTWLLARLWAVPVLLVAGLAVASVVGTREGAGPFPAVALLAGAALALGAHRFMRARAHRDMERCLREPTPDAAVAYVRRTFERVPTRTLQQMSASSCAIWYALYGDFARAHDALAERSAGGGPALLDGMHLQARALVHFLSGDDVARGLELAREAEQLTQVPRVAPGSTASRFASATYVDLGRVLAEGAGPELADTLVARAAAKPASLVDRLVSRWTAAVALAQAGRHAEAAAHVAALRELAPHCAPLLRSVPTPLASGESGSRLHATTTSRCARCRSGTDGSFTTTDGSIVCARCREQARAARLRLLAVEGRMRGLGLLLQILCALGSTLLVVPILVFGGDQRLSFAPGMLLVVVMAGAAFQAAGRLRRALKPAGTRLSLVPVAPLLLVLLPFGPLLGGYMLWLCLSKAGREVTSHDHRAVVAATPEIVPPSPWRFARLSLGLLLVSALCMLALLARDPSP